MTVAPSIRTPGRASFIALSRVANAIFFLVTATYCLLTYSSFAYQQFLRPHLVSSLASFVVWHHLWHWVMLGLTTVSLLPELKAARGRYVAWTYLAVMTGIGVVVLFRPILPSVENDALGLKLAFAFLVPPIWLGIYDHLATAGDFNPAPSDDRRILWSVVAASVLVWAVHAGSVPFRFDELGDLTVSRGGLVFGAATSFAVHLIVFGALGLVVVAALRAARVAQYRGLGEFRVVATTSTVGCFLIAARFVFAALSFRGAAAWLLAAELALALTIVWSGVAQRLAVEQPHLSALEAWFGPIPGTSSRLAAVIYLALLPVGAFMLVERVSTFDWDFLIQNLCVLAVWLLGVAFVHALLRPGPSGLHARPIAMATGMLLVFAGARGPIESGLVDRLTRGAFVPEFALDGYAALDPSYRLIRHMLWVEPPGSDEFFDDLRANSLIQHVDVAPIDVDFVKPLQKAAEPVPHIFLFVIDSLRRDYVSVYNPAVTFTPSFARFAADGYAFERAFTAYGGTGLSMPAIWTGGMLLHKEYVLPFHPMNTLEKLLTANRYRLILSPDHITTQLLEPETPFVELDQGRDEMQYDFCSTLGELQEKLKAGAAGHGPVFVHTRSLNLHVSKLTNRSVAIDHAYDGFQGPAAAAVRRMDGCFGGFLDGLQRLGLYDNSIIILTSDHGDSLGEAKRWGHSYTIFPEIVRTPLLVHVPAALRTRFDVDPDAVSQLTDITPSLYALLGYAPASLGWPYGSSLFVPHGTDVSGRRRETLLVASSYGPVYGLLTNNGEALYIADGVNARDYAYDLSDLRPARIGVTPEQRESSRAIIRQRIATLAGMYHFSPKL